MLVRYVPLIELIPVEPETGVASVLQPIIYYMTVPWHGIMGILAVFAHSHVTQLCLHVLTTAQLSVNRLHTRVIG